MVFSIRVGCRKVAGTLRIQIIRWKYAISKHATDKQIFYCSRINYHGARDVEEKVEMECAQFIATGKLPEHMIRCSARDVNYPKRWMQAPPPTLS